MNEMIKALKENCGPAGDLYLGPTKAAHLIRWLEICEQTFLIQEGVVKDLIKALHMEVDFETFLKKEET